MDKNRQSARVFRITQKDILSVCERERVCVLEVHLLSVYVFRWWCVGWMRHETRKLSKIKSIWYKVKTMYRWRSETKGNSSSQSRNEIKDNKTIYRSGSILSEYRIRIYVSIVHVFWGWLSVKIMFFRLQKLLGNRGTYLYVTKSSRKPVR